MKLKDIFKNTDTYVMCSTLNQIVNYIPIEFIKKNETKGKKIEIFNITMENNSEKSSIFKRFNNADWDDNLFGCLKKIDVNYNMKNSIKIKRNYSYSEIKKAIKNELNLNDKGTIDLNKCFQYEYKQKRNIIWNITGGQRSTIAAIQEYILENGRQQDYVIYLEGNSNKIVCGKLQKSTQEENEYYYFKHEILDDRYEINELNLKDVFELAGFTIRNYDEKNNLLKVNFDNLEEKDEFELCNKMYKYYVNEESDVGKCLRENLPILNKGKSEKKNQQSNIKKEEESHTINVKKVDQLWDRIKKYEEFTEKDRQILIEMKGNNTNKFGYILELMTICSIKKFICEDNGYLKKYFKGLYHSVNLDKNKEIFKQQNTKDFCEFDIVLLSKSGQVVIFECKSGTMGSDVSKARQYTGYAAAGVYGKPILITPLLKSDRKYIYNNFRKKTTNKELVKESGKKQDQYKQYDGAVLEALRAAARANMEVWGIDEIGERLKDLYNELARGEGKNE